MTHVKREGVRTYEGAKNSGPAASPAMVVKARWSSVIEEVVEAGRWVHLNEQSHRDTSQKPYHPSPSAGSQGTWFCAQSLRWGRRRNISAQTNLACVCIRLSSISPLYIEGMRPRVKRCNWHVEAQNVSTTNSRIDTYTES